MRITGWPVTTLVRGTRVWDRGEFRGEAGFGRFLPCGKPTWRARKWSIRFP
jgi:dihydropyrimidinase